MTLTFDLSTSNVERYISNGLKYTNSIHEMLV